MPLPDFKTIRDDTGKIDHIETNLIGNALLRSPELNKGCAFSLEERDIFSLNGLLPPHIDTLEQQIARILKQYHEQTSNLSKNIFLNTIHDYNQTLFYRLLGEHLEEMLPIIYTPTVGEVTQRFSLEYRRPRGIFIGYNDRNNISTLLDQCTTQHIDLSVVTDGEAVLGIGDQGIGGIQIAIAKLMVYGLCAGLNPHRFLPIQLDVGTNNLTLLNDPHYLGWRHERVIGQAYDDFIEAFVQAITKKFPHLFLHWEDFGRSNARRILTHYRKTICTFNGDMQGTGTVALAAILAAIKKSKIPLPEHHIVIFGAGTAGTGIADQTYQMLMNAGLSDTDARSRFWLLDKNGLLTNKMELAPEQSRFGRDVESLKDWNVKDRNHINLEDVVKHVKPTILIGCSTVAGAFSENIIKAMAESIEHPIIMPLTNPNTLVEAKPEDLIAWTKGKAIIATGSPFPKVKYQDKLFHIAQCNNALVYPGVGLGAIISKARHVSDEMLWAAVRALSECVPVDENDTAPLIPPLCQAKKVSMSIALAVAQQARDEGLAQIPDSLSLDDALRANLWEPIYYPYKKI